MQLFKSRVGHISSARFLKGGSCLKDKFLTRKAARTMLEKFRGKEEGILVYLPSNKRFLTICFGNGCNDVESGCDSYLYLNSYVFDGYEFVDDDGGMLDYNEDKAQYGKEIRNTVFDAISFMFGTGTQDTIPDFVPLCLY